MKILLITSLILVLSPLPTAAVEGTTYHGVRPCRAVDTRIDGQGYLWGGESLDLTLRGSCGIPMDAAGVIVSVQALAPFGADGFLTIVDAGDPTSPNDAAVRWRATDATRSNEVTVLFTSESRASRVHGNFPSWRGIHVVLDVYGYYR